MQIGKNKAFTPTERLIDIATQVKKTLGKNSDEKIKNVFLSVQKNGSFILKKRPLGYLAEIKEFFKKEEARSVTNIHAFVHEIDLDEVVKDEKAFEGLLVLKTVCKSMLQNPSSISDTERTNLMEIVYSLDDIINKVAWIKFPKDDASIKEKRRFLERFYEDLPGEDIGACCSFLLSRKEDQPFLLGWIEKKAISCRSKEELDKYLEVLSAIDVPEVQDTIQTAHDLAYVSSIYFSRSEDFFSFIEKNPDMKKVLPLWISKIGVEAFKKNQGNYVQIIDAIARDPELKKELPPYIKNIFKKLESQEVQDLLQLDAQTTLSQLQKKNPGAAEKLFENMHRVPQDTDSIEKKIQFLNEAYRKFPEAYMAEYYTHFMLNETDRDKLIQWIEKKAVQCQSQEAVEKYAKVLEHIDIGEEGFKEKIESLSHMSSMYFLQPDTFVSFMEQHPGMKELLPIWLSEIGIVALEKHQGNYIQAIDMVIQEPRLKEQLPSYIKNAVAILEDEKMQALIASNGNPVTLNELQARDPEFVKELFKKANDLDFNTEFSRRMGFVSLIGSRMSVSEKDLVTITSIVQDLDRLAENMEILVNRDFAFFQNAVLEVRLKSTDCNYKEVGKDFMRLCGAADRTQRTMIMEMLHDKILPELNEESIQEMQAGIEEYEANYAIKMDAGLFKDYLNAIFESVIKGQKDLFPAIEAFKKEIRQELQKAKPDYKEVGRLFSCMIALDSEKIAKNDLEKFLYAEVGGFLIESIFTRSRSPSSEDMRLLIKSMQDSPFANEIFNRIKFFSENIEDTVSLPVLLDDMCTDSHKYKAEVKEYKEAREKGDFSPSKQYLKDIHRQRVAVGEELIPTKSPNMRDLVDAAIVEELEKNDIQPADMPHVKYQVQQFLTQTTLNMANSYLMGSDPQRSIQYPRGALPFKNTYQCTSYNGKLYIRAISARQCFDVQTQKMKASAVSIQITFDLKKMDNEMYLYTEGCCTDMTITSFGAVDDKNMPQLIDSIKRKGFIFAQESEGELSQ